ncbi:MAG: NADH-quinone oxidoreductase subunit A [Anaerolineae bacterium]|nr:NADH-quinone oxidoreductase subunit A [Promineifilum sp.]MCZ2113321.1 NADH-quinone oxidoreductase subunit A [Anaerolineae bacterium]HNS39566.1 NADH-quinone oxidoreductase subunit A [Promineifilum sp.]
MEQTFTDFLPVAVLFGISIFFALLLPILSLSLGPKRLGKRALAPYESGMTAVGEAQRRLPIKFYRIAVLFILFDIDIILLMPWAVTFRNLGYFGLAAMLIFMVMFIIGDLWVWRKGVLEWE